MSTISSGPATPPSSNPDSVTPWRGGKPTNKQVLQALEYNQIGGGKGAPAAAKPKREDADYVVRSASSLAARAKEAGKLVWIPDDAAINISGMTLDVYATVASSRGHGDSEGALVYSNDKGKDSHAFNAGSGNGQVQLRGSGRLVGFRLRGFAHNYWPNPEHPGYIPMAPGATRAERDAWRSSRLARGIRPHSSNVRVENMEIYGWAYAGMHIGSGSTSYSPRVWWCHFHDNMMTSYGYGVDVVRGRPNIRYCYFNAHRHAIAGFGFYDCSFVLQDCVFGPSASSFQVDMHGLHEQLPASSTNTDQSSQRYIGNAGGNMVVRRCSALYTNIIPDANYSPGAPTPFVQIRGIPWPRNSAGILIENNAVAHTHRATNTRDSKAAVAFYERTSGDGWTYPTGPNGYSANYRIGSNSYDLLTTVLTTGHGAPVDLRGGGGPGETPSLDPFEQDPDPGRRSAVVRSGKDMIADLEELQIALEETNN